MIQISIYGSRTGLSDSVDMAKQRQTKQAQLKNWQRKRRFALSQWPFSCNFWLSHDCQLFVSDVGRRRLRSADIDTYIATRTNTRLGDKNFAVAGSRLWSRPLVCQQNSVRQKSNWDNFDVFVFVKLGRLLTLFFGRLINVLLLLLVYYYCQH